jgi:dihydroneopterin aldolase
VSEPHASLRVTRIVLPVHLGWESEERSATQPVEVELELRFERPPRACATDDLQDAVDYGDLVQRLSGLARARAYRLIEHLGRALFDATREALPDRCRLALTVSKWPPLEEVEGVAAFRLAEWE